MALKTLYHRNFAVFSKYKNLNAACNRMCNKYASTFCSLG